MTTPWDELGAGAGFPSLSSLTGGSSGGGNALSSPLASLFSGGGAAANSGGYHPNTSLTPTWGGGTSSMPTWGGSPIPPSARNPPPPPSRSASSNSSGSSSGMTMPNGFSSPFFAQPKQAAASGGGSFTSPAALTAANSKATNGAQVAQGGVTYTPLANSNTTPTGAAPALRTTAANPAAGSVATARDQYGREFNYASSVDSGGGSVVGVSANGTVLKKTNTGQVYDTGATATAPRVATATAPKVGTPTGVLVKRSQPTISSGPTPEEIEKQRRDSGYYLQ